MNDFPAPGQGGHGGRVAAGAAVLLSARLLVRLAGVLSVAVLARLLSPEDYGVMALALVALGMAQMVSEIRIVDALVRTPNVDDSHYATAFTLAMLRGVLVAGATAALAAPIADVLDQPALAPVLRVLALSALLDGLVSPRLGHFMRSIDFRVEATIAITAKIGSIAVSIAVALVTGDYWALVIGAVAGSALRMVLSYALAPWRPWLSLRHWRGFMAFGAWLSAAASINFLNYKADTVLIGAVFGAPTVGQFAIGEQISTMATHQIATPLSRAIYAGLAQVAANTARLRQAYIKAQQCVLGIVLPIGFGTGLAAGELVRVIAGSGWELAVLVVQVTAPTIAVGMVNSGAYAVLMATNDTRSIFMRNLLNLLVRLPLIVAGLLLYGIPGILAAMVLNVLFFIWNTARIVAPQIEAPIWAPLAAAWRSFVACAAMVVAALAAAPLAVEMDLATAFAGLALKVGVSVPVYIVTHAVLWRLSGYPEGVETTLLSMLAQLTSQIRAQLHRRAPR